MLSSSIPCSVGDPFLTLCFFCVGHTSDLCDSTMSLCVDTHLYGSTANILKRVKSFSGLPVLRIDVTLVLPRMCECEGSWVGCVRGANLVEPTTPGNHFFVSNVSGGMYPGVPPQPLSLDPIAFEMPKSIRTTSGAS